MRRRTILLFESSYNTTNQQKFMGIHDFARKANWRVQSIPYARASRMQGSDRKTGDISFLLNLWKPDGCIIEGNGHSTGRQLQAFDMTPLVILDAPPNGAQPKNGAIIAGGQDEIAEAAARELLKLPLQHFAYAAWTKCTSWDKTRHLAFAKTMQASGKRCLFFRPSSLNSEAGKSIGDWLVRLPKPCGIFAANDFVGVRIIEESLRRGLSVPDDLSVIGVDNETSMCENASVPLSSIEQDCRGAGYRAAEALSALMDGRKADPTRLFIGISRVVRRQSTALLRRHDARVSRALEFIRQKATEGIGVSDVVAVMGCSPRLAHRLFADLSERTILEEIHGQRLERAKDLLRHTELPVTDIADSCGYASIQDFSRVFRKHVGLTPLKWRRAGP